MCVAVFYITIVAKAYRFLKIISKIGMSWHKKAFHMCREVWVSKYSVCMISCNIFIVFVVQIQKGDNGITLRISMYSVLFCSLNYKITIGIVLLGTSDADSTVNDHLP